MEETTPRTEDATAMETGRLSHVIDGDPVYVPADDKAYCLPNADLSEIGDCVPLYNALIQAKLEWPSVLAASTGQDGNRKFQYADMADIAPVIDPHLAKHGLVAITPFSGDTTDNRCRITVVLAHRSGARLVANLHFQPTGDIKKLGGQSTYLARYAYCKMLGIAAEEDPNKHLQDYSQPDRPSQQRQAQRPRQTAQKPAASKPAEKPASESSKRDAVIKSLNPLFRACGITGRIAAAQFAEEQLGKQPHEANVEELLKLKSVLESRIASQQQAAAQ